METSGSVASSGWRPTTSRMEEAARPRLGEGTRNKIEDKVEDKDKDYFMRKAM